jgi:hypothetical protein
MDWQDELRALDGRLAEGQLSQAEYRKLRDQVLAEASSGGPVHRPAGPEHHDRVHIPSSAAEEAPLGEMTQVISADEVSEEQTLRTQQPGLVQTAPPPTPPPVPEPEEDADKTVIVGKQDAQSTAYQPPARAAVPPPPPWETGPTGPAPMVQGNEVFSVARKDSPGRRAALGSLAVLVVLALIGAGVWFFVLRDDTQAAPGPTQPNQTAPGPSVGDIESKLPKLAGVPGKDNSTMSLDKAESLHITFGALKKLYASNGANEMIVHAYSDANGARAVYVVPLPDKAKADTVTQGVHDGLTKVGYADAKSTLPDGIKVVQRADDQTRYLYATYTSGADNVQISVLQPVSAAPADLTEQLRSVFTAIAGVLPVG